MEEAAVHRDGPPHPVPGFKAFRLPLWLGAEPKEKQKLQIFLDSLRAFANAREQRRSGSLLGEASLLGSPWRLTSALNRVRLQRLRSVESCKEKSPTAKKNGFSLAGRMRTFIARGGGERKMSKLAAPDIHEIEKEMVELLRSAPLTPVIQPPSCRVHAHWSGPART